MGKRSSINFFLFVFHIKNKNKKGRRKNKSRPSFEAGRSKDQQQQQTTLHGIATFIGSSKLTLLSLVQLSCTHTYTRYTRTQTHAHTKSKEECALSLCVVLFLPYLSSLSLFFLNKKNSLKLKARRGVKEREKERDLT